VVDVEDVVLVATKDLQREEDVVDPRDLQKDRLVVEEERINVQEENLLVKTEEVDANLLVKTEEVEKEARNLDVVVEENPNVATREVDAEVVVLARVVVLANPEVPVVVDPREEVVDQKDVDPVETTLETKVVTLEIKETTIPMEIPTLDVQDVETMVNPMEILKMVQWEAWEWSQNKSLNTNNNKLHSKINTFNNNKLFKHKRLNKLQWLDKNLIPSDKQSLDSFHK